MPAGTKKARGRLSLLYIMVATITVILIVRLYQIQIVEGQKYRVLADRNRLRLVEMPAARGVIYANNGEILARNLPSFTVQVIPADLPKDAQGLPDEIAEKAVLDRLERILGTNRPVVMGAAGAVPAAGMPAMLSPTPSPSPESGEQTTATPTVAAPALPDPLKDIPERQPWFMTRAEIEQEIEDGRLGGAYRPITVATHIPEALAFKIAEDAVNLPGVQLVAVPIREYPAGMLVSHILGYMGPISPARVDAYKELGYNANDQVGLVGLESSYEAELHGQPGRQTIEVNVNGHRIRTIGQPDSPKPGYNLVLNLDLELQRVATEVLQASLNSLNSGNKRVTQGAVVALDPRNGAVLALVSLPSYDNNLFAKGITPEAWNALIEDPDLPLINKAVTGQYPPGSIFKVIPASAGLQEGIINVNTKLGDGLDGRNDGIMYLANKYFPWDRSQDQPFYCWIHNYGRGHGMITVRDALAQSCDIYFYQLGGGYQTFPGLGSEMVGYYARQFGLDEPTGIELEGEAGGLVPDPKWKRLTFQQNWYTGDTYNMSIGQGDVLATPLQMANVTAAVANRGTLYRPQLGHHLTDANGNTVRMFTPEVIHQVAVDPAYLDIVREGMYGAVNWPQGTAKAAKVAGVDVAGKTGTAEFFKDDDKDGEADRDARGNLPTHAWFTAFAPYGDPEIVVTVFVANGGEGSATSVPIAQRVLEAYFQARASQ